MKKNPSALYNEGVRIVRERGTVEAREWFENLSPENQELFKNELFDRVRSAAETVDIIRDQLVSEWSRIRETLNRLGFDFDDPNETIL